MPRLTALADHSDGVLRVESIVRSDAALRSVAVWYCPLAGSTFDDRTDRYRSFPLERVAGTDLWHGTAPLGAAEAGEIYWYVEAVAAGPEIDAAATTMLERIRGD
jgi:hypothetical protein